MGSVIHLVCKALYVLHVYKCVSMTGLSIDIEGALSGLLAAALGCHGLINFMPLLLH